MEGVRSTGAWTDEVLDSNPVNGRLGVFWVGVMGGDTFPSFSCLGE